LNLQLALLSPYGLSANNLSSPVLPGIFFLLTLAFGFWLSRSGRPYNGILFNIHKLAALAGVVLSALQLYRILASADVPVVMITGIPVIITTGLLLLAGVSVLALFISGALMSAGKLDYRKMLAVHNAAPFLLAACLAAVIYVLSRSGG
jgi:hypothetical protein